LFRIPSSCHPGHTLWCGREFQTPSGFISRPWEALRYASWHSEWFDRLPARNRGIGPARIADRIGSLQWKDENPRGGR
jgi:hypothetical protein